MVKRDGVGEALNRRGARCRRRGAQPWPGALPGAKRALWGVSEVLVGVVQVKGRREGERSEREAG